MPFDIHNDNHRDDNFQLSEHSLRYSLRNIYTLAWYVHVDIYLKMVTWC